MNERLILLGMNCFFTKKVIMINNKVCLTMNGKYYGGEMMLLPLITNVNKYNVKEVLKIEK